MKQLRNLFCLLFVAIFFAACSDDDTQPKPDPEPDPKPGTTKNVLLTKIETEIKNKKLPYLEFTYDENDRLTKAVRQTYDDEGELDSRVSFTLTRSGNTAVTECIDIYDYDEDEEERTYQFKFVYDDSGQVTELIKYASAGNGTNRTQSYEWASGHIVKVSVQGESASDLSYDLKYDDKGNVQTFTIDQSMQIPDGYLELYTVFTPVVNQSKISNIYSLIPLEYSLLFLSFFPADVMRHQMSTEITSMEYRQVSKKYPGATADGSVQQWENVNTNVFEYTYKYNDENNFPVEVIETFKSRSVFTDYSNSANNTDDSGTKIKKMYPTYLVKEK